MNRVPRLAPLLLLVALALAACQSAPDFQRLLQRSDRPEAAAPRAAAAPESSGDPVNRIAFLANDQNVYTIDPAGLNQVALTSDASRSSGQVVSYQHITWAPDGQTVAFVRLAFEDGQRRGSLVAAVPDGTERRTLFNSDEILPFYISWSPDSSHLTFLSNDPDSADLGLFLSDPAGGAPELLDRGQPYYWTWAPDSSRLFVHTGARARGRLAFLEPVLSARPQELDLQPTTFQAPSWSADGQRLLAAIENDRGGDSLVLIDPAGAILSEITELAEQAAFVMDPTGERVAVTEGRTLVGAGTVGRLQVFNIDDPADVLTAPEELVLTFFWSPDGEKIVYFALDNGADNQRARLSRPVQNQQDVYLGIYVLDVTTGVSTYVDAILPTEGFVDVIPYFDQYHNSATIWSPDSTRFLVAALDEDETPTLFIYSADGSAEPQLLARGGVGFWSAR